MIATHSEHPPAAAIAFAFVLFKVGILGILVIALGILIILAVRFALERLIFRFDLSDTTFRKEQISITPI